MEGYDALCERAIDLEQQGNFKEAAQVVQLHLQLMIL